MKKIIALLLFASVFAACTKSSSVDKKAELEKLRKQQSELANKIKDLETQIAKEDPDGNKKVRFIEVDTISKGVFSHFVEVQGRLEAEENINLSPRSMGVYTQVNVKEGDAVRKGQVLAVIDDNMVLRGIDELKTGLELATTVYNKQKNLWDQKIGTEIQYLQAKGNKESLERKLATLNEQLDLTRIKSPIDGTVDAVTIKVGEMANNMMPAIRVVSSNDLRAKATIAETYMNSVGAGDEVILTFPDIQKTIHTKLNFASKAINQMSRTFDVSVKLPNDKDFRPNMLAVMNIVDYRSADAISIPMKAVQNDQEGQFVMTAVNENGRLVAKKKQVKIGMISADKAEVLSGLAVGEMVITIGFQDLNEGDLVKL